MNQYNVILHKITYNILVFKKIKEQYYKKNVFCPTLPSICTENQKSYQYFYKISYLFPENRINLLIYKQNK